PLFQHRDAMIVDLAAPPAKQKPWLVSGHRTRSANGEAPMPQQPIGLAAVAPAPVIVNAPAPAAVGERDGVVIEYLRTMRSMITAQRDVMLSYLGSVPAPMMEVAQPVIDVRPQIAAAPALASVPMAAAPVAAAPAPAPVKLDPMQLVISIVSERTGYPAETLGIDLDLEADLSIDSIKRIEIIGELAQRLGLRIDGNNGADALVEELATKKTLRGLVGWLVERMDMSKPGPAAPSEVEQLVTEPAGEPADEIVVTGDKAERLASAVQRYRLGMVEVPVPVNGHTSFAGKKLSIYDGGLIGDALAARLQAEGAIVFRGIPDETIDGFIDLGVVDGVETMRGMFERVRAAALGGAKLIYVATMNGELGRGGHGGPAGLIKTVAAEWPDVRARVVDLDSIDSAAPSGAAALPGEARHAIDDAAATLHRELHADDHHVEIGYVAGVRSSLEVIPADVPIGDVDLDRDSVVLVTGGARGITAKVAIGLAQRHGCRIVLCGRSVLPGPEDPKLAAAHDAKQLRGVLAKLGGTPAIIEARVARVLADREIRATLEALGDRAEYHAVDVRTPELGALIDDVYAKHGRIDAVIHGAGILEDKLIRHKTPESFERVFATKLTGAQTLVDRLRDDVKLVVLFSSISGAFGNRGQVDYAAAGDALDKLAWRLQRKIAGRVVSIDWGPWAGTGMVSAELEREYAKRQIRLIDPEHGVEALLTELRAPRGEAQVIWTASDPRGLLKRPQA
ncbi:MAG TPA: SDR family NAD(P)-dependent oxidoreductase, partial [Kofleriaceae bacterium]